MAEGSLNKSKQTAKTDGRRTASMVILGFEIHPELWRYIKFSLAGLAGVPVNLTTLFLLTEYVHLYYALSAVAGFLVAGLVIFAIQTKWTFNDVRRKDRLVGVSLSKFYAIRLLGELIYMGLLILLTEKLGLWYMLSAVVAICLAFPVRYTLDNWWIWGRKFWQHIKVKREAAIEQ